MSDLTAEQIRYRVEQAGFIPGDDDTDDEWLVERAALAYADVLESSWVIPKDAPSITFTTRQTAPMHTLTLREIRRTVGWRWFL